MSTVLVNLDYVSLNFVTQRGLGLNLIRSCFFIINSLILLAHQVREARQLLDEALRELRGSDRGEGVAGQGRADGEGIRRDAGTAPGTADEGACLFLQVWSNRIAPRIAILPRIFLRFLGIGPRWSMNQLNKTQTLSYLRLPISSDHNNIFSPADDGGHGEAEGSARRVGEDSPRRGQVPHARHGRAQHFEGGARAAAQLPADGAAREGVLLQGTSYNNTAV